MNTGTCSYIVAVSRASSWERKTGAVRVFGLRRAIVEGVRTKSRSESSNWLGSVRKKAKLASLIRCPIQANKTSAMHVLKYWYAIFEIEKISETLVLNQRGKI